MEERRRIGDWYQPEKRHRLTRKHQRVFRSARNFKVARGNPRNVENSSPRGDLLAGFLRVSPGTPSSVPVADGSKSVLKLSWSGVSLYMLISVHWISRRRGRILNRRNPPANSAVLLRGDKGRETRSSDERGSNAFQAGERSRNRANELSVCVPAPLVRHPPTLINMDDSYQSASCKLDVSSCIRMGYFLIKRSLVPASQE